MHPWSLPSGTLLTLRLRGLGLTALPCGIRACKSLELLDLSHNQLVVTTELPVRFSTVGTPHSPVTTQAIWHSALTGNYTSNLPLLVMLYGAVLTDCGRLQDAETNLSACSWLADELPLLKSINLIGAATIFPEHTLHQTRASFEQRRRSHITRR